MRLLVIGDLHLPHKRSNLNPPSVKSADFDLVVTLGDIVDSSAKDLMQGREFYRTLNKYGIPILTIPGNHDFKIHDVLIDGFENVYNIHQETFSYQNLCFAGLGSDRFDDGLEIRLPIMTKKFTPDILETTVDLVRRKRIELSNIIPESIKSEDIEDQYQIYHKRYQKLSELNMDCRGDPCIFVTHVPPYNTSVDMIREIKSSLSGHHWGSLSLKHSLQYHNVSLVLSGHIHEAEGYDTVARTRCLNAGYRRIYDIEFTDNGDNIRTHTKEF